MDLFGGLFGGGPKKVDYLSDPRLELVSFGHLKTFMITQAGCQRKDLAFASNKFTLLAYCEQRKIALEPLLYHLDQSAKQKEAGAIITKVAKKKATEPKKEKKAASPGGAKKKGTGTKKKKKKAPAPAGAPAVAEEEDEEEEEEDEEEEAAKDAAAMEIQMFARSYSSIKAKDIEKAAASYTGGSGSGSGEDTRVEIKPVKTESGSYEARISIIPGSPGKSTDDNSRKSKDEAAAEIQAFAKSYSSKKVVVEKKKDAAAAEIQNFAKSYTAKRLSLSKPKTRYNTLRESPAGAEFTLCVVQFKVPGAANGGSDKGPDGNRIDSIPIANGVIEAGAACDLVLYDSTKNVNDTSEFEALTSKYDALIVRINPGQLSQGTSEGTQQRFDELMNKYISMGKLVWSSPKIQTQMGAKDALVKIAGLNCGLTDTLAYYSEVELVEGFRKTMAFQPRVIKQNRGSAGEGIWLCWLWDKERDCEVEKYPASTFGSAELTSNDYLKLMEMNDNHVEYHTIVEFLIFCVIGPGGSAGEWESTFPGKYLEGGKEAGGQLVDQRLLPRIDEGEVRILMAGDTCQMAIHKKPLGGGLSAVGGNSAYTYYKPSDPKYKGLVQKLYADIPTLLPCMGLQGEPLPLLWTADYIPKNPDDWPQGPYDRSCPDELTEYTVGEFNCSCVGISKFQAVCGGDKTLADVPDEDYFDACELTELMGVKAIEMLKGAKKTSRLMAAEREGAELSPMPDYTTLKGHLKSDWVAKSEWLLMERAKAIFAVVDADKNGSIDRAELYSKLRSDNELETLLNMKAIDGDGLPAAKAMGRLLVSMDTDAGSSSMGEGVGVISWEEFEAAVRKANDAAEIS